MGIDGIFLLGLKSEIAEGLIGTRVDKIHQPSKEELVFLFRAAGVNRRLYISIRPSSPRLNFTASVSENPPEPPMFCMLLRKHLGGAKFLSIEDCGFERIAVLKFQSTNEMGDIVSPKLCIEFIGKQTNVILIGGDGRIIDSIRRSDLENDGRIIQPGAVYVYPEKQSKQSLRNCDIENSVGLLKDISQPLGKALVSVFDGVSPLISREISVLADIDTEKKPSDLSHDQLTRLELALEQVRGYILSPKPTVLFDENKVPFEFSYMPITQYGNSAVSKRFSSFSELLDAVYSERDRIERMRGFAADLVRLLNNLRNRAAKKTLLREKELARCLDGEKYRIYGELLKAYSYMDFKGQTVAKVSNYYDDQCGTIEIPLDPSLSAVQNATKYFKEYKKICNAKAVLGKLIEQSKSELEYIESVIDELSRASTVADLKEIREELALSGYVKKSASDRKKQTAKTSPIETVSPDGYKVLIGRNNRQNDILTLHTAEKTDMWFHTKNIPGSHVIVKTNGEELPESTILFAAQLAAEHSRAADSSAVPVDYTLVKFVKKPVGAKPGMVIYKTNKTVFVKPRKEIQ